jgi:rfaE bifunctional protein kinase chain/domain
MKKRPSWEKILDGFSKVKLLVIGDIMLDRFIWGKVSRLSPEAPVPVVLVERESFLLGGAANVVHNVKALGGQVSVCGVVGDDEMGIRILKDLDRAGVGTRGVIIEPERQTTVKTRVIAHHQQVVRIDREAAEPLRASTVASVLKFVAEQMSRFDGVILSDYGKGLLTERLFRATIRKAKETKTLIMVDPKPKNIFFCKGATVITPNTAEAGAALGVSISTPESLRKAGNALLKRLHCQVLVITRGEEGMAIFEPHREPFFVPTVAREVYDVTGAGDTVIGTMALAMASGVHLKDAVRLANYAAGIVVGKMGTATVTPEELIRVINEKR